MATMNANTARANGQSDDHALLATLEATVVPELLALKLGNETLRVWMPDCASGEFAYAVADLLYSQALLHSDPPAIQIFATDSDPQMIASARQRSIAAISSEQQPGFSSIEQPHQFTSAAVRRLITFAEHQLARDPPFANLDLVICTNLIATFPKETWDQILYKFHWSLRPSGYLLLGAQAQSIELPKLFLRDSHELALFQRRGFGSSRGVWQPDLVAMDQPADRSLQVVNEQLLAMNQELRRKIGQLAHTNDDLQNLLRATDLATLFLDRNLRITRFTTQAQQIFNLIRADRGRPLAHITHSLEYEHLSEDAANVLANLQSVEREVHSANGCWYLLRLHPYRTTDERVVGVVLTLLDISTRVQTEAELRRAHDELEQRVQERTEELSMANSLLRVEIAERARLEQERTELLRKLVTTQEDERRRIARELHDQFSQSVTEFSLGLGMLANPALDSEQREQTLARLQQLTAQIDQDMGRLAMDLRPTALDDLGLLPALQNYVERWVEESGIPAEFQATGLTTSRVPSELESVVYRVIQEALTNVLKHAEAQHVSIIVEQRHSQVRVIVEDNGRGFDPEALQQAPNVQGRLGLLGMRERIALVGGTLSIESAQGAGTTLFVQLPIDSESPEESADR
jgi:PAS domain S-box-containing protein